MKKYYIIMKHETRQDGFVYGTSDVDYGGSVDGDGFDFKTKEEAEEARQEIIDYAYNKACQEDKYYERYHTREDMAEKFFIDEFGIDEEL